MNNAVQVFVYGTLKPGESYYDVYCGDRVVASQPAIARGQLYALPVGYPAMTPGTEVVHGFLLSFTDPEILVVLDEYEGYNPQQSSAHNDYERVRIEVFDGDRLSLGHAWTYQMTVEQAQAWGGVVVPDGLWFSKSKTK